MFYARIYTAHSVFDSYLNIQTVKIWRFMIRRIGDCALSSALFSPTIPLLNDVTRSSPDDEFQELLWTICLTRVVGSIVLFEKELSRYRYIVICH